MSRSDELKAQWSACDLPDIDAVVSGPGRLYLAVVFRQYMEGPYIQLCDFDDAQDLAAFVRYCLLPGIAKYLHDSELDLHDTAVERDGEGSQELARFEELVELSERAAAGPLAAAECDLDELVGRFNDYHGDYPELQGVGTLLDLLFAGVLGEQLAELEDDDGEPCELARLVADRRLDEANPRHRELASEYLSIAPEDRPAGSI